MTEGAADARDPGQILDAAAATLDFSQPVAPMMLGIRRRAGLAVAPDPSPYGPPRPVDTLGGVAVKPLAE
jgi:hypothetical protein